MPRSHLVIVDFPFSGSRVAEMILNTSVKMEFFRKIKHWSESETETGLIAIKINRKYISISSDQMYIHKGLTLAIVISIVFFFVVTFI